jgi:hypothetical protein
VEGDALAAGDAGERAVVDDAAPIDPCPAVPTIGHGRQSQSDPHLGSVRSGVVPDTIAARPVGRPSVQRRAASDLAISVPAASRRALESGLDGPLSSCVVDVLAGPYTVAVVVLALAGAMKVVDAAPTQGALRQIGLPAQRGLVVTLGAAEIAVGVAALTLGTWWTAALVALGYATFTVFVGVALARRLPLASCGCFGRDDTPPSWFHVVLNVAFAATAVGVAASPFGSIDTVLGDQPAWGVPFVGYVALGVAATYLMLSLLPQTLALAGEGPRPTPTRGRGGA